MLPPFRPSPPPITPRPSGAALILVLTALALVSFLALIILTFVRNEDRATRTTADLMSVRQLSELPEKLMMAQIHRATSGLGATDTWTSQPGMIRRFGNIESTIGPRPPAKRFYKLYSSDVLIADGNPDPLQLEKNLAKWQSLPAAYTDLNEAVRVREPRRSMSVQNTSERSDIYPILDPDAVTLVDGLKVQNVPTPSDRHKLPMPAMWLYILRDGTVVAPSNVDGKKATIKDSLHGATKDNPVVGRIAFWTDDDCCKLNVNTATEAAPWEAPHTHTKRDEAYAEAMPAKGEHYRVPAHPSFTSLAPALAKIGQPAASSSTSTYAREPEDMLHNGNDWWSHLLAWHEFMPRTATAATASNGSRGGTVRPDNEVEIKQERLFATVDELFFIPGTENTTGRDRFTGTNDAPTMVQKQLRKVRGVLTTHSRAPELNPFNRPKISLWPMPADEVMRNDLDKAFARVSSLRSTGALRDNYFLQRDELWTDESNPGSILSTTQDWNAAGGRNSQLMGWLQTLTEMPFPGFGGQYADGSNELAGKYGARSRNQMLNAMFDIIRCGINTATPDSQVTRTPLTPTYRAMPAALGERGTDYGQAGGSALPLRSQQASKGGEALPGASGEWTQGFGRFPTISEAAIAIVARDSDGKDLDNTGYADTTKQVQMFMMLEPFLVAAGLPPSSPAVRYMIEFPAGLPEIGDPVSGTSVPFTFFDVKGSTPPTGGGAAPTTAVLLNRVSSSPSLPVLVRNDTSATGVSVGPPFGGDHSAFAGFASQFLYPTLNGSSYVLQTKLMGPGDGIAGAAPDTNTETTNFSWISDKITLPPGSGREMKAPNQPNVLNFSGPNGGPLRMTVLIYDGAATFGSQQLIQRIDLDFPPTQIPVPLMTMNDDASQGNNVPDAVFFKWRFTPQPGESTTSPPRMTRLFRPGDVVRSVEVRGELPPNGAPSVRGDMRLIASRLWLPGAGSTNPTPSTSTSLPPVFFMPSPNYFNSALRMVHTLRDGAYMMEKFSEPGSMEFPRNTVSMGFTAEAYAGQLVARSATSAPPYRLLGLSPSPTVQPLSVPAAVPGLQGAINFDGRPGDFDNGPGIIEDGPYIRYPDGNTGLNELNSPSSTGGWFTRGGSFARDDGVTFSPWRQAGSAIIFGSLPSAVYGIGGDNNLTPRPWQTLLFCPNPASRITPANQEPRWDSTARDHFGFLGPRDHLWLEFFWMPPVEPDGLCDAFATEGKVNMNFQMLPFSWIDRSTALHGALHGVRITAIPSQAVSTNGSEHYKNPGSASPLEFRYEVNADLTLDGFRQRFAQKDVFRSPSEICDVFLAPKLLTDKGSTHGNYTSGSVNNLPAIPTKYDDLLSWWEGLQASDPTDGFEATGDNLREAPYGQLYPRLCTRSNVFTVHWRVQVLKKSRSTAPDEWDEDVDHAVAEQRGSTMIERYLDPNAEIRTDFATTVNNDEALDDYYKMRVVNRRTFAP